MDKFIVVLTDNRNTGTIAVPYLAVDKEDSPSLHLSEKVNTENPESHNYPFSDEELEIIHILDKISDKHLFKYFSKDANIKAFYEKLEDKKLEEIIRPHIEKYMMQCFKLLANKNYEIYFKDSKYSNIYKSDKVKIHQPNTEPVFYFNLNETGIEYTLKIKSQTEEDITLTHKKPLIITHKPCCLLIRDTLYLLDNTDSKKFLPFFDKSSIKIQERSVPTYMSTFVANALKNNEVKAKGFNIISDSISPHGKLSVSYNLQQEPIVTLEFCYGKKTHLANSKTNTVVELETNNNNYTFIKHKRNNEYEDYIISELIKTNLSPIGGPNYYPKDYEAPYEFQPIIEWYNTHKEKLQSLGLNLQQGALEKEYYIGEATCEITTTEDLDWYDLQMVVNVGEFTIPFLKFRKYIIAGKNEYELPDGKLFVIPKEWYTKYQDILMYAEEHDKKLRIKRIFHHLIEKGPSRKPELQIEQNSSQIPDNLNATLRPYQHQGFSWMNYLNNNNYGGILADDMGLGKTLQTITLLLNIYNSSEPENHNTEAHQEEPKKSGQLDLFSSNLEGFNTTNYEASLIVMPTSLIHNWLNEFKKFAPSLKVYVYSGSKRLKSKEIGNIIRHYHVVLSSYGVVRNDVEYLKHYPFHYFILDESQYIKNPTSKIYEAITQIQCRKKMVLTGTPIENSLTDLWAQMNFVNEGLLGNLNFFKKQFVQPITKLNNEEQEQKLQKLIEPFVLRRTKEKVAKELPPVTEQIMVCDMTPDQQKVYDREKSGIRNELLKTFAAQGLEKSTFLALQGLTQLRQIANHPKLVDPEYKGKSGKFEMIIDHLHNIISEKHKVLIFSSFVKDLELIEHNLKHQKITYSKLTGSTTNRQKVVDDFEKNDDCKVFLISLKAGGVGLNLISADYVFLLNPWWNPAAEAQAINRAHRIGQTKNVFVYRFISSGTIEEKIMKLQEHKSKLADTFINSNNPFKNMSENEIADLFS